MTRHMLGLFTGLKGARQWRRTLTTEGIKPQATLSVITQAAEALRQQQESE
jgi:tRNA-dihydrouridine synthase A